MPFTELALAEDKPCQDGSVLREGGNEPTDSTSWFIKDKFTEEC